MISGTVQNFSDPLLYQYVFHAADVEILPTARGKFNARLTQIRLNKVWMQRAEESLPRVLRGTVSSKRAVVGFLTSAGQAQTHHRGVDVSSDALIVNNSDVMHRRTDGPSQWGSMSLRREELQSASKILCGHELNVSELASLVRPNPDRMARLRCLHQKVGRLAEKAPARLSDANAVRAIENELINAMVRCLDESSPVTATFAGRNHARIIRRFEEFLAENILQPLYIAEICSATGASESSLRACCQEHFGMGPVRYLWLRRMHLVRRALLLATSEVSTVARTAMDHGFWELGRFSTQYRSLFGEFRFGDIVSATSEMKSSPPLVF